MPNAIARVLKGIAVALFIIGFIGGIILGNTIEIDYHTFNMPLMLGVWIGCFLEGMIFLALSEIIQLAADRNAHLMEISKKLSAPTSTYSQNAFQNSFSKPSTHQWRCPVCGNMIAEDPCPYCHALESH